MNTDIYYQIGTGIDPEILFVSYQTQILGNH